MKETYWQQYINFLQGKTSYTREELHRSLGYPEFYRKRTRLDTYRNLLSIAGYLKVERNKPVIILKPIPSNLKTFWLVHGQKEKLPEKLKIANGNRDLFVTYNLKKMPESFLSKFKELAEYGFSSSEILKQLRIGQQVAKRWREENPAFAKAWSEVVHYNKYKSRPRKSTSEPLTKKIDLSFIVTQQTQQDVPSLPFSKVI